MNEWIIIIIIIIITNKYPIMVRVAYIEIINVMVATRMQNLTTTLKQLVVIDQQIGVSLTISPSAVVHLEKKRHEH